MLFGFVAELTVILMEFICLCACVLFTFPCVCSMSLRLLLDKFVCFVCFFTDFIIFFIDCICFVVLLRCDWYDFTWFSYDFCLMLCVFYAVLLMMPRDVVAIIV